MTIKLGQKFPYFSLKAVSGGHVNELDISNAFINVDNSLYKDKWLVIFFYPMDFTFVCPTEIKAFNDLKREFDDRDAILLTCSTDSEFTHLAWRKNEKNLNDISIPMLSDKGAKLSTSLGILSDEHVSQRATFIVDQENSIRFSMVTDSTVGRNPNEVLRVLDALQIGKLCPCNWEKGDDVITLK